MEEVQKTAAKMSRGEKKEVHFMKKTKEAGLLNLIKSSQRNMPVTYKYIKEVNIMKIELI